jgi:hypothetical protein
MSYVDEDLRRASRLVVVAQPGADVAQQVRALCLAFSEVRRAAFERAALTVESCPVPADDIPHTHLFVTRDAVIAQRIRSLK